MLPYLKTNQALKYFFPFPFDQLYRPTRLRVKLRWESKHVAPKLERLYFYYRDRCNIIDRQPHHSKNLDKYDAIGKRLAQMWTKEELTPEMQVNHYSYAENRPFDLLII